jgi:hypothetical protein
MDDVDDGQDDGQQGWPAGWDDEDLEPERSAMVEELTRAEDAFSAAAAGTDSLTPADAEIALQLLAATCRHVSHLLARFEGAIESDFAQLVYETDDGEVPIVLGVARVHLGSAQEHLIPLASALREAREQLARLHPWG